MHTEATDYVASRFQSGSTYHLSLVELFGHITVYHLAISREQGNASEKKILCES